MKFTATFIAAFLAVQIYAKPLSGGEDLTGTKRVVDQVSATEWEVGQEVKDASGKTANVAGTAASGVTFGAVGGEEGSQVVKKAAAVTIEKTVATDIHAHQEAARVADAVVTGVLGALGGGTGSTGGLDGFKLGKGNGGLTAGIGGINRVSSGIDYNHDGLDVPLSTLNGQSIKGSGYTGFNEKAQEIASTLSGGGHIESDSGLGSVTGGNAGSVITGHIL